MKNNKKIVSSIIAVAVSIMFSVITVSAESIGYDKSTRHCAVANSETTTSNEPIASKHSECLELNKHLEAGETVPVHYFEDGSCLMVTLEDSSNSLNQRSSVLTQSKSYIYTYKNLLGQTKNAFRIKIDVDYQLDDFNGTYYGGDTKIINMYGAITVYDDSFNIWWEDGWTSYAPTYATLGVQGTRGTELYEMAYSSSLNIFNGTVLIEQFYPNA